MKKTVTTAVLLCAFAAGTAHAEEKADPNDPCAMVLCLAGKLDGSSPAECDPMYKRGLRANGTKTYAKEITNCYN